MKDINWLEEARAYDSLNNPETSTEDYDSNSLAIIGGVKWCAKSVFKVEPNVEQIERDAKYLKEGIVCKTCKKVKMPCSYRKMKNGKLAKVCKRCADKWRATEDGLLQTKLNNHCARTNDKFLPVARYKATLEHFNHACAKCGCDHKLHIDHIVPVALGGRTVVENLVPLCEDCNLEKSSKEPVDFFGKEKLAEICSYFEERLAKHLAKHQK